MTRRRSPTRRPPLPPEHLQYERMDALDLLSRQRALDDAESHELERLMCADYARRRKVNEPIPRGIA